MSKTVFERNEKKYIISAKEKDAFLNEISEHIKPDKYCKYTICNIYYDTPDYQLIRNSLEKPVYKEKLRLRSYGVPNEASKAFLEIKKKYKGVVGKRRIERPLGELEQYLKEGAFIWKSTQISNEIDYLIKYRNVEPKVYLAYDREAYSGKDNEELRITFDTNIRFRFTCLDLKLGDYGTLLNDRDFIILEIKTIGSMPLWLTNTLSKYRIYPSSFSKYGTIYSKYIGGKEQCLTQSYQAAI